jgi:hypothetical protein
MVAQAPGVVPGVGFALALFWEWLGGLRFILCELRQGVGFVQYFHWWAANACPAGCPFVPVIAPRRQAQSASRGVTLEGKEISPAYSCDGRPRLKAGLRHNAVHLAPTDLGSPDCWPVGQTLEELAKFRPQLGGLKPAPPSDRCCTLGGAGFSQASAKLQPAFRKRCKPRGRRTEVRPTKAQRDAR